MAREAACYCLGELAVKINRDAVKPLVPKLLDTLLARCEDGSWAVRESTMSSIEKFLISYATDTKVRVPEVVPLLCVS